MKNPRLWDIVQIDWLDSMHSSGWHCTTDVDWKGRSSILPHKSVGYLAYRDRQSVTLVQSITDTWEDGRPTNVDAIMTIPRCAVTGITVLARKQKR